MRCGNTPLPVAPAFDSFPILRPAGWLHALKPPAVLRDVKWMRLTKLGPVVLAKVGRSPFFLSPKAAKKGLMGMEDETCRPFRWRFAMAKVQKRPLPRQQCQVATRAPLGEQQHQYHARPMTPTSQQRPCRIPVATPVPERWSHHSLRASVTPEAAPMVGRPRNRLEMIRAREICERNRIIACTGLLFISIAMVLLLLLFGRSRNFGRTNPTPSSAQEGRLASPTAPKDCVVDVYDAVDVYEFLKAMQGSAFLAEGDMQRLLGKPYSVTKSPKGEIRTHLYNGGAVQYQLSKHDPMVIGSVALKKAAERSRDEIKRGDFQTACRLLRVSKHREYCLLMLQQQTDKRAAPKSAAPSEPTEATVSSPKPARIGYAVSQRADEPQRTKSQPNVPKPDDVASEDAPSEPVQPLRVWTSADGKHKCRAEFLKFENSKVYLKKEDGSTVTLSSYQLVDVDRVWIQRHLKQRKAKKVKVVAQTAVGRPLEPREGLWQVLD